MSRRRFEIPDGTKFGRWTVLAIAAEKKGPHIAYECRCECGTERAIPGFHLRKGKSKSCGCSQNRTPRTGSVGGIGGSCSLIYHEPGTRFGKWTVIELSRENTSYVKFECRCDCGNVHDVFASSLRSGKSTKCRACGSREALARREAMAS